MKVTKVGIHWDTGTSFSDHAKNSLLFTEMKVRRNIRNVTNIQHFSISCLCQLITRIAFFWINLLEEESIFTY